MDGVVIFYDEGAGRYQKIRSRVSSFKKPRAVVAAKIWMQYCRSKSIYQN